MKKAILLTIVFIIELNLNSYAQVIVNENFTTGWDWFTTSSSEIIIDKKADAYNWDRKTTGWYCTWKPCELIQSADYKISCEVKHISGVSDHGAGLMFGQKDLDNFFSLQISANGFYVLYEVKGGQWYTLIDWTTSVNIIQANENWNEIGIQKSGTDWQVFINGKPEKKTAVKQFYGTQIGFIVDDIQKIKFDNLKVEISAEGVSAQSTSLWEETFSDNSRGWVTGKGDYGNTLMEGGMIKLTGTTEGNLRNEMPTTMDFTKDFSITSIVTHQSGTKNFGYGILFGGSEAGYFWCFLISANDGYIFFQKGPKGSQDIIIPWTSSAWVNKGNEANTLMVKSEGGDFKLYVNNHLLTSLGQRKAFGNRIGLYVGNKQEVWFDNIAISTVQTESNENVLLQENFNDANSACVKSNNDYYSYISKDNKLYVELNNSNANYSCDLSNTNFNYVSNYSVSADMVKGCDTIESGIGVMVNKNVAYFFTLYERYFIVSKSDGTGNQIIVRGAGVDEGTISKWKQINYMTGAETQPGFSKSIRSGVYASNQLKIEVHGSQIIFFVNNQQVATIDDSSAVSITNVGAYATGNPGTVIFDNFKVVKQ